MANARKNSIHHQMKLRTTNRSEYNDCLLRVNQRQENRLTLELEQWEKAQRMVAKGLDKESQWFKQRQSVTSLSGYNPQRTKKNSLTDPGADSYNGRLIPDYQYRNRANVMSDPVVGEPQYDEYDRGPVYTPETEKNDLKDQTDSSKTQKKSSSKSAEGEGNKNSGSKHGEHRRSSHTHRRSSRHQGERAGREKDGERRDADKPASGNSAKVDKTALKTAAAETLAAPASNGQAAARQTKTSARNGRKFGTDSSCLTTTNSSSTTNTTTDSATASTETAATKSTPSKAPHMVPSDSKEDVHDPGDITPRSLKDLGWDGRRRYTNVWDSLSMPKHTSQVRSVRSRLQREFTQVPSSNTSPSRGAASARRSARATSLS